MTGGGGPACCGKLAPLCPFALGQIHQCIARKCNRRNSVGLRTEARSMFLREFVERSQVSFVRKFGESLAPIVPYRRSFLADVADQRGQVWREIVSTAFLKFVQQIGSP